MVEKSVARKQIQWVYHYLKSAETVCYRPDMYGRW